MMAIKYVEGQTEPHWLLAMMISLFKETIQQSYDVYYAAIFTSMKGHGFFLNFEFDENNLSVAFSWKMRKLFLSIDLI